MKSKLKKLFLRILFIPIVGFFVLQLFSIFGRSLNSLIYDLTNKTDYHVFLRYDTRDFLILWFTVFWIVTLLLIELLAAFLPNFRFNKLLTNLRYAPFFILLFSTLTVIVFDFAMIEYSKWKIKNYIYSNSPTIEKPEITLHNNYRGWCGNGFSAQENYLYFDTVSEGFNSEKAQVRSRSLLMAAEVRDWINGGDQRFNDFLIKSCRDSETLVHETAETYLQDSNSNCKNFLSSK